LSKITELILEMKLISNVTFFGTVENYLGNLWNFFPKFVTFLFYFLQFCLISLIINKSMKEYTKVARHKRGSPPRYKRAHFM